jgi:hypothetical protein
MVAVVSAVAAWFRIPPVARDTLWAEDGRNFIQSALNQGPVFSLFDPYAGYLHTLPRIIASLTVVLTPVTMYAYAITAGACIATGGAAAVVFVCSRDAVAWMPGRFAIAALTVLAPLEPREVLGTAANLHSIMLWMMFWMLLYRPRSRTGSILLGVAALLAAATEIQCLFLLPLLLWGLRDRRRWPLRTGLLLGLAAQVLTTVVWPRAQPGNSPVGVGSILYGYLINSLVPIWIPQKSVGPAMVAGGAPLAVALTVPIIVAAATAFRHGTGSSASRWPRCSAGRWWCTRRP